MEPDEEDLMQQSEDPKFVGDDDEAIASLGVYGIFVPDDEEEGDGGDTGAGSS